MRPLPHESAPPLFASPPDPRPPDPKNDAAPLAGGASAKGQNATTDSIANRPPRWQLALWRSLVRRGWLSEGELITDAAIDHAIRTAGKSVTQ